MRKLLQSLCFAAVAAVALATSALAADATWTTVTGSDTDNYVVRRAVLTSTTNVTPELPLSYRSLVGWKATGSGSGGPSLTIVTGITPLGVTSVSTVVSSTAAAVQVNAASTNVQNADVGVVTRMQAKYGGTGNDSITLEVFELKNVRNPGYRVR